MPPIISRSHVRPRHILVALLVLCQLVPFPLMAAPASRPQIAESERQDTQDTSVQSSLLPSDSRAFPPPVAEMPQTKDTPKPVTIMLQSAARLLAPGESTTLSLMVESRPDQEVQALSIAVTLPAPLQTSTGERNLLWTWSPSPEQPRFEEDIQLQMADEAIIDLPRMLSIRANALLPAGPSATATLRLGIHRSSLPGQKPLSMPSDAQQDADGALLISPEARIIIFSPEEADIALRYTELYRWDANVQDPITGTPDRSHLPDELIPTSGKPQVFLPLVIDGEPQHNTVKSAGLQVQGRPRSQLENGLRAYQMWRVDAERMGTSANRAIEPYELIASLAPLIEAGIDPHALRLWTRADGRGTWRELSADYNSAEQTLVVHSAEVGQYALGEALTQGENWLPSTRGFASDRFTGAAQVDIPIEAPAGLGGLKPDLHLRYSSAIVDDIVMAGGDDSYALQASVAGYGWSVGGISYIVRRDDEMNIDTRDTEKVFSLVLDGQRVDLRYHAGAWRTDPELFARVEMHDRSTGNAQDVGTWLITMPNGNQYRFGDAPQDPHRFTADSALATVLDSSNDGGTYREGRAWYLRSVVDPLGNHIEFDYAAERGNLAGFCANGDFWHDGRRWYTRKIVPAEIRWSGNPARGATSTMRLRFDYATDRADYKIAGYRDDDCVQAEFSRRLLKAIRVQIRGAGNGDWHTLRSYALDHHYDNKSAIGRHVLLDRVRYLGARGGQLQSHSFTYDHLTGDRGEYNTSSYLRTRTVNNIRLLTADNGSGGRATYTYTGLRINYCHNSGRCHGARYPVARFAIADGLGNTRIVNHSYGTSRVRETEHDTLEFMGYRSSRTTSYALNSTSQVLRTDETLFHQGVESAPSPAIGRPEWEKVWHGNTLVAQTTYGWSGLHLAGGSWKVVSSWDGDPLWIRQDRITKWVGDAVDEQRFSYETNRQGGRQYGNVTRQDEWGDGVLQRTTYTQYFPNVSRHIVDKAARIRAYDGNSVCFSELRLIYGDGNIDKGFATPPSNGLIAKSERALARCSDVRTIGVYDRDWAVSRFRYDVYGNQTLSNRVGDSDDGGKNMIKRTAYDSTYHLFPTLSWNHYRPEFKESTTYYGVNGPSLSDAKAFWGAPAEQCDVRNICARTAYDEFGRPQRRWDYVVKGSAWAENSDAATLWEYRPPGSFSPDQRAYIVTEWNTPRCHGNFVRRHYDGLGQLIAEQRADEDWQHQVDGCGTVRAGQEIDTYYAYDALGNRSRASVPRSISRAEPFFARTPAWHLGYSATQYDALGRPTRVTAPHGAVSDFTYNRRVTYVIGRGRNGAPDKIISWRQMDGLGYLARLRQYNRSSSKWTLEAEVKLTHDITGNLRRIDHAAGKGRTTMTYDVGGRRIAMNDADMGRWTYAYDRHDKVIRQTDARGKTICLYYDPRIGRLTGKQFRTDTSCPTQSAGNVRFSYDGGHSSSNRSRGQLTAIRYANDRYSRELSYNGFGQKKQERVTIAGASTTFVTRYGYDQYRRPTRTIHPDGDTVTVTYNGMGLPNTLTSSHNGTLVDGVAYEPTGQLSALRYTKGKLWRTLTYYPWHVSSDNGNGRLAEIRVGTSLGSYNRLRLQYRYDTHGNVSRLIEDGQAYSFAYDGQNRLTAAFGRSYVGAPGGNFRKFAGQTYGYTDASHPHALQTIGNVDRFDYDRAGNMTVRNKGTSDQQALTWNHENRLARISRSGLDEQYLYDEQGRRVRIANDYGKRFFVSPDYELASDDGGTILTKSYRLGDMLVAIKRNDSLLYVHHDLIGSPVLITNTGGKVVGSRRYNAYGTTRRGTRLPVDYAFTGQREDLTGLVYFNARYYDPEAGAFISPDPTIPDPTNLFDYNRYLYARGNPVKYNDPGGQTPWDVVDVAFWAWSAKDLYDDPSWSNAGWLALDTVSLIPLVPSASWVRRGAQAINYADDIVDVARAGRQTGKASQSAGRLIELLHGTSAAETLFSNGIDVGKGAGQLGPGFYMTFERKTAEWFARFWSLGEDTPKLLKLQIPEEALQTLKVLELEEDSREYVRLSAAWASGMDVPDDLRHLIDDYDAIIAPVFTTSGTGTQVKFNPRAQEFLDQFVVGFEDLP